MKLLPSLLLVAVLMLDSVPSQAVEKPLPRHKEYLKLMEERLSDEDKLMLGKIYEPTVVGVPPENARSYVCIMPDGEIRAYGSAYRTEADPEGMEIYLSSTDCGLSWKRHLSKGSMKSAAYFPQTGQWLKSVCAPDDNCTYALVSAVGPDDAEPMKIRISDRPSSCAFLPQKSETSERIFFTAQLTDRADQPAAFFYSDDNCRTFSHSLVYQPCQQELVYPHKGLRWSVYNGTEPYVCQMSADRYMMLLRNSTDCFYQSFSYDEGTTWTTPEPSPFNGTDTTPFILPLSDGRILTFWNNTRPLPELDHTGADNGIVEGKGEDFFTNRDAAHVAISEDCGKTWRGARELYLNSVRNNADFRYVGNPIGSYDKSVHQFQAFELPFNKVLVILGQNEVSRRMLIFDVDWLYETDRFEDFYNGLANVSTQVYLKSEAGHTRRNGHCAYNRTNGAVKAMDPTGSRWEVVQISRVDDPRLLNPVQGLVWNFPASLRGTVEMELYLAQDAVNVSFNDRWTNPCDVYEPELSMFTFHLDSSLLKEKAFHRLAFRFDLREGMMRLFVDGKPAGECAMKRGFNIGLSYVNIQSDALAVSEGVFLKTLRKSDD